MQTIVNAQGQLFTGWLARPESWPLPQWSPVRDGGIERAVLFPDGMAQHVALAIQGIEPCTVQTWVIKEVGPDVTPLNSGDLIAAMFRDAAGS